MTPAVTANSQLALPALQTKSELAQRLPRIPVNLFCHIMGFLKVEQVARCDATCKSWRIDERAWKAQATRHDITIPQETTAKELFQLKIHKIYDIAFGKKAWQQYLQADVGITPPIPLQACKIFWQFQAKHTLTLIPATINGQPTSFSTFAPIAEQAGMKLNILAPVSEKYGNEPVTESRWVWMEKNVKPGSRGKTQAQAVQAYPKQLGKALDYTISIVAHFARHKICLIPENPWTYTRTCDGGQNQYGDWFVVVGGSAPGLLDVCGSRYADDYYGVSGLVPAEVPAIGP